MNVDEYGRPMPPPTWAERVFAVVFVVSFIGVFLLLGWAIAEAT